MTARASAPVPAAVGTTLAEFARQVGTGWSFPEGWAAWPPDMFAFTSLVMRQTGCYRYVIDRDFRRGRNWQEFTERLAERWLEEVDKRVQRWCRREPPADAELPFRCEALEVLRDLASKVTLEELRALSTPDARKLARALITVHAIADEACSGFGLLGRTNVTGKLAAYVANLLLTGHGSLSNVGKHLGVVLPKMRTPQSGLTLRSLSHQVTFHSSEVEVMWRTIPWTNVQENTINVLLVPAPATIHSQCFVPAQDTFAPVRYFSFDPQGMSDDEWTAWLEQLVTRVLQLNLEVDRLHMIVLPELALRFDRYQRFLLMLHEARARTQNRLRHVPLVVTGVQRSLSEEEHNEVHLAAYFAGRWYELSQRKHHRWKLDRNQVRQYDLQGRFPTARSWYEQIPVTQRRLTFLAPNWWLTLCPLICEDLAQLEPVSDVIRGVGPTLLAALLMDGPQLKERWSARYASVLADDPGTAVLTLTSLGMAERCRRIDEPPQPRVPPPDGQTVGLWKDQLAGWRLLELPRGRDLMLLTISSTWKQEYTADGRTDHNFASVFQFEGVRDLTLATPSRASAAHVAGPPTTPTAALEQEAAKPRAADAGLAHFGDWADIRELSATTFAMDALLELRDGYAEHIIDWLGGKAPEADGSRIGDMLARVTGALRDPRSSGIDALHKKWPTEELAQVMRTMRGWFAEPKRRLLEEREYWDALVGQATQVLGKAETRPAVGAFSPTSEGADRVRRAVALMVLNAIHSRLEARRYKRTPPKEREPDSASLGTAPPPPDEARLMCDIERLLDLHA